MTISSAGGVLLHHVAYLCNAALGVSYQAGEESRFITSLRAEGLAAGDVTTLDRLLKGRAVKLADYQGVVRDLSRLRDERVADETIRRRYEDACDRFDRLHGMVMSELEARDLQDTFARYAIALQPVLCGMGYLPAGGVRDVAYEFRHFVECEALREGVIDLFDLSRHYVQASSDLGQDRMLWNAVRKRIH